MEALPSILHIDGDDFFASLARLKDPKLNKRPVIVGNLQSRGTVIAASYEARESGIQPGLSMPQAGRLCPDAALVQVDWDLARRAATAFSGILGNYSPLVERAGLDAAFLDYTGSRRLFGPAPDFARRLQNEIREALKFPVSVGLAPDKAVSAVACRAAKLGRFEDVHPGEERVFLRGCPVGWLPGVNPTLEAQFRDLGIKTIGELSEIPSAVLSHLFGTPGRRLADRAQGNEQAIVRPDISVREPETEVIFPSDLISSDALFGRLAALTGSLASALRVRRRSARRLIIRLTYSDAVSVQRQVILNPPSHRDPELLRAAAPVLRMLYNRRVRVRRLALKARYLIHCPPELPFGDAVGRVKWDQALAAVDSIRARFPGSPSVMQMGAVNC